MFFSFPVASVITSRCFLRTRLMMPNTVVICMAWGHPLLSMATPMLHTQTMDTPQTRHQIHSDERLVGETVL